MTARTECRLLLNPPGPGAWNMAVDEALLEWSAEQGGTCWRFYGWQEPTLSLGYFQDYHDRWRHSRSQHCPAVRRLTGGGAIVHDAELTYSVVVPRGRPLAARRNLLYETIHTSLVEALAELGIAAAVCESRLHRRLEQEPLLCFQRQAPGDVFVEGTKIAGSAQRRRRGAVLQHGSVLLSRSSAAPELPALADLVGRTIPREELARAWLAGLRRRLGLRWRRGPLTEKDRGRVASLVQSRYGTAAWTENRER